MKRITKDELNIDAKALEGVKAYLNTALRDLIATMTTHHSNEGEVGVKIRLRLCEDLENESSETAWIPDVECACSSSVTIKAARKRRDILEGYRLTWDMAEQAFVFTNDTPQMSIDDLEAF